MPDGLQIGLLITALGFGLRHGLDWDHIAAITDITSSERSSRRAVLLATLYALGHGLVVFALGTLAIMAGELLPSGIDAVMERFVGATLLLLGVYVFYSLARNGKEFRLRSRWMLLIAAGRKVLRWVRATPSPQIEEIEHDHEHGPLHGHNESLSLQVAPSESSVKLRTAPLKHRHRHRHTGQLPEDPFMDYGPASSFGIGMLHGIGAETATQVLLFLAAAQAGGKVQGLLLLLAFVLGLLACNSIVAGVSALGFSRSNRSFGLYAALAVTTGTASMVIGSLLLISKGSALPPLLGG